MLHLGGYGYIKKARVFVSVTSFFRFASEAGAYPSGAASQGLLC